ncbi:hypothetical protein D3C78_1473420 [compost metagenome]
MFQFHVLFPLCIVIHAVPNACLIDDLARYYLETKLLSSFFEHSFQTFVSMKQHIKCTQEMILDLPSASMAT